jgi:hypothetical protein
MIIVYIDIKILYFCMLKKKYDASSFKYAKKYRCMLIFCFENLIKKEAMCTSIYYKRKVCICL